MQSFMQMNAKLLKTCDNQAIINGKYLARVCNVIGYLPKQEASRPDSSAV